jgi:hypothetical protein
MKPDINNVKMNISTKDSRVYRALCIFISLTGYVWAALLRPPMHGGSLFESILMDIVVVVGCYCSVEWLRSCNRLYSRILVGLWATTYASLVCLGLYYGVKTLLFHFVT